MKCGRPDERRPEPGMADMENEMKTAVLLILFFTFDLSVVRDIPFKRRFIEMAGVSLGVAALSFFIGYFVRIFLNVDI